MLWDMLVGFCRLWGQCILEEFLGSKIKICKKYKMTCLLRKSSCAVLISGARFSGFNNISCNFQIHDEAIVITEAAKNTETLAYRTFECEVSLCHTKGTPVVVRILDVILAGENVYIHLKKYDDYYTTLAVGTQGSRFNIIMILSQEEKRKVALNIETGRDRIVLEVKMEIISNRCVSSILKCRSTLEGRIINKRFEYVAMNEQMCYWYKNCIVDLGSIKYRNQREKESGID